MQFNGVNDSKQKSCFCGEWCYDMRICQDSMMFLDQNYVFHQFCM